LFLQTPRGFMRSAHASKRAPSQSVETPLALEVLQPPKLVRHTTGAARLPM
jgi:hypothetical protein